jgi:hypothetical protein
MIWRIVVACALLFAPVAASAAAIEDFFGKWRGVEVVVEGSGRAIEFTPGDLDMEITDHGDGFRIRTHGLGREDAGRVVPRPFDAAFAPTDTPGVFAFEPSGGSLLSSLFADPAVGNPLEGDTLLWARLAADTLHVYSLAIDDRGGFLLEQSTGTLTKDGMATRYDLRLENDQVVTIEGRLERAGD